MVSLRKHNEIKQRIMIGWNEFNSHKALWKNTMAILLKSKLYNGVRE